MFSVQGLRNYSRIYLLGGCREFFRDLFILAGVINHYSFGKNVNCATKDTGTRVRALVNSPHPSLSLIYLRVPLLFPPVFLFASLLSCHPLFIPLTPHEYTPGCFFCYFALLHHRSKNSQCIFTLHSPFLSSVCICSTKEHHPLSLFLTSSLWCEGPELWYTRKSFGWFK